MSAAAAFATTAAGLTTQRISCAPEQFSGTGTSAPRKPSVMLRTANDRAHPYQLRVHWPNIPAPRGSRSRGERFDLLRQRVEIRSPREPNPRGAGMLGQGTSLSRLATKTGTWNPCSLVVAAFLWRRIEGRRCLSTLPAGRVSQVVLNSSLHRQEQSRVLRDADGTLRGDGLPDACVARYQGS